MNSNMIKGVALASWAGVCWGSMSVAAQYLMTRCGFNVLDLTSMRLFGAGVVMILLDILLTGTKNARGVFRR